MTNTTTPATPDGLARLFHATYERLAPSFGYETRLDTKQFDPETPNGRLMVAVCGEVIAALSTPLADNGLERVRTEFLPAILHGDETHRAWLREAVDCFLAGKPVPPPTGTGSPMPVTAEGVETFKLLAALHGGLVLSAEYAEASVSEFTSHAPAFADAKRFLLDRQYSALTTKADAAGEGVETIRRAEKWLRECSSWLLSTDLDMQCPMDTDPLDIADDLAALSRTPSQANDAAGQGEVDTRVLAEAAMAKARDEYHELYSAELRRLRALLPYVYHKPGCRMRKAMGQSCVCGLERALNTSQGEG